MALEGDIRMLHDRKIFATEPGLRIFIFSQAVIIEVIL
jgi:hypothetical protein